jgi:hypothetical protein
MKILREHHKYLKSFEAWCWRRTEKVSWTDRVKYGELEIVKKERNLLSKIKRSKANRIANILHRNCLLKQFIEGKIEGQ